MHTDGSEYSLVLSASHGSAIDSVHLQTADDRFLVSGIYGGENVINAFEELQDQGYTYSGSGAVHGYGTVWFEFMKDGISVNVATSQPVEPGSQYSIRPGNYQGIDADAVVESVLYCSTFIVQM